MRRLGEQKLHFRTGRSLVAEFVGAGELEVGVALYLHTAIDMKKKGAPVDWVMAQPAVASPHPTGLSGRAPNPHAGKLFIRYMLSEEVQQYFATIGRQPARKGVPMEPDDVFRGVEPYPSQVQLSEQLNEHVRMFRELLQAP